MSQQSTGGTPVGLSKVFIATCAVQAITNQVGREELAFSKIRECMHVYVARMALKTTVVLCARSQYSYVGVQAWDTCHTSYSKAIERLFF